MTRKILIMGLPGAGKTTLATVLAPLLNAVVFNADAVRANLSRDLGFSHDDRVEHARRMGWICDRVVEAGGTVIADFICPTADTRAAFGEAFTIWVDRIEEGRFEDTNRMFVAPERFDLRVKPQGAPEYWAEQALLRLRPAFEPQKPTALFINNGRGPTVDEAALVKALQEGWIAGAALDVFEREPAVSEELLGMENVVLTPHIASATRETRLAMGRLVVSALRAVLLEDRIPENAV